MTRKRRQRVSLTKPQEKPLSRPKPPSPSLGPASPPHALSLVSRFARLLLRIATAPFRLASRLWHHPRRETFWSWFFRFLTLLSVSYLVYDRIYETEATIEVSASDPAFPFTFPFIIKNNSHISAIDNVRWACRYIHMEFGNHNTLDAGQQILGSTSTIAAGKTLNINCNAIGPNSRFIHENEKPKISSVTLAIELSYVSKFFGLLPWHRHPTPTLFTWFPDATNPQWIKGDFAR
jgi:hypothetical protein